MSEATITISVDEYFELRQKAQMNDMLMYRLGEFEGRLCDYDRRIFELEQRLKERENNA